VATVDNVGILQLKLYHMESIKELRDAGNELAPASAVKEDLACSGSSPARNKSDQVISGANATAKVERAPDQGLELSSFKLELSSTKLEGSSFKLSNQPVQSPSDKRPNLSNKRQASSLKLQALLSENHGTWILEKF